MSAEHEVDTNSDHSSDLLDETLVTSKDKPNCHNKRTLQWDHYQQRLSDHQKTAKRAKQITQDDISSISSSSGDSDDSESQSLIQSRSLRSSSSNHNGNAPHQMPSPNQTDDSFNWEQLFNQENENENDNEEHDVDESQDMDDPEETEQFNKNQKLLAKKKGQSVAFCFAKQQIVFDDISVQMGAVAKIETVDDIASIEVNMGEGNDDEKNMDQDVTHTLVFAEPYQNVELDLRKISVKDYFSFGMHPHLVFCHLSISHSYILFR